MLSTAVRISSRRGSALLLRRREWVSNNPASRLQSVVHFSTDPSEKKDDLRDTVNRIKSEDSDTTTKDSSSSSSDGTNDLFRRAADTWELFSAELGTAWDELINSGKSKDINKKLVRPTESAEGNIEYTGPVEIMVIDESEHLTAWERMQRRLTEAPIIQGMLERADDVLEKSGAKKAKARVDDLSEDAREAWETSQNPWVYRISSVYDTVTAESEYTVAVKDLRQLDPDFELEDWQRDVVEHTLPQIMKWFLEGKINQLKPWMGEGVFKRIAAEITARKQEGVQIDTHVLGIMNSEILSVEQDTLEKGSPIILLHFMCQQINCVIKKKDGTIVEGAEDDIRANSYVAAFQREYNEEKGELNWKIVDFRFNGAIAYL
jgi:import inner membrane translocase subunit TIM44